MLLSLIAA